MISTEEVVVTPIEVVSPLKPSEAMRLGAISLAHITGNLFEYVDGKPVGGCAMGMIAYSYGKANSLYGEDKIEFWPDEFRRNRLLPRFISPCHGIIDGDECPTNGYGGSWRKRRKVTDIIMHLNDEHDWTITEMANWLEKRGL